MPSRRKILWLLFMGVVLSVLVIGITVSQAQNGTIRPLELASITSVSSTNAAGNAVGDPNSGISIFTGAFPTPYTECGYLNKSNVWETRAVCSGKIAVGSYTAVAAQTLTITGTTVSGKTLTLNVSVPAMTFSNNGNFRLYVADDGSTYYCASGQKYATGLTYPNDCDLTADRAFVAGNQITAGVAVC